jgi:hypothetical protein
VRSAPQECQNARCIPLSRRDDASAEEGGLFVLTVATHGVSDQGGDFLVATDSLKERTLRTGIAVAELFDEVSRAGAERRLVLLDACRERLSQGTRGEAETAMAKSFADAIARAQGSVVLSASTLGGFAYDDQERKNGVFTAAVLDGLRGEAKATMDGWITVRTLADFVQQRVAGWVRRNRPDHAAKSLGIARRVEATAEGLPLAPHPEAIRKQRSYRARREAALARVKENQGRVLTGALWDQIVVLLPEQESSPEAERLLEEIEALDGSERAQRSLRDFLRELSGGVNQPYPSRKQAKGVEKTGKDDARPTTRLAEIVSGELDRHMQDDPKKAKLVNPAAPVENRLAPVTKVWRKAASASKGSDMKASGTILSKVSSSATLTTWILAVFAIVTLLTTSTWVSGLWRSSAVTDKPENTALSRVSHASKGQDSIARNLQELRTLQDFQARQRIGVRLLVGIAKALPDFLWLDRLTLNAGRISVEGQAYNTKAIADFIENLDKLADFSEPTLDRTEERQSGIYFFVLTFGLDGLPVSPVMTSSLEKERDRLLRHLADREKVNETLKGIRTLLEEKSNIQLLAFKPESRQEAGDQIEIFPLFLKLGVPSTHQLALLLDQLNLLSPQPMALRELVVSPDGQKVVADLLLEIPALKDGIQRPPATGSPEPAMEKSGPEIANFSREPLRSLLADKVTRRISGSRPEGVPGLLIGDLELTGIFNTSKGFVAQVVAKKKKKSYLLKEGDQLYDGDIVSISKVDVVFKQIVQDPGALKPFREVVMSLAAGK